MLQTQLKQLTALTHMSLVLTRDSTEATSVLKSVATCTSLESVSLAHSDDDLGAETFISGASMLSALPHLTALALDNIWQHPVIFHHSLIHLTHLLVLDMRLMHGWNIHAYDSGDPPSDDDDFQSRTSDRVYFALQDMPQLLRFHSWQPGGEYADSAFHTDILLLSLPHTLTALDLQGNNMQGLGFKQLSVFTNLRCLSLQGCTLPRCGNWGNTFPSALCSLNAAGCGLPALGTLGIVTALPQHMTELDVSGSVWCLLCTQELERLTALQRLSLGAHSTDHCFPRDLASRTATGLSFARALQQLLQLRSLHLQGRIWKVEEMAGPVRDCGAELPHLTEVAYVSYCHSMEHTLEHMSSTHR